MEMGPVQQLPNELLHNVAALIESELDSTSRKYAPPFETLRSSLLSSLH